MAFRYAAFVLIWTWGFWSVPVVTGGNPWEPPFVYYFYLGGVGPLVGGLGFMVAARGAAGLRDLGARLIDVRRIGGPWWLAVLLLAPAVEAAAYLLTTPFTAASPGDLFRPLHYHLLAPRAFAATAAFTLFLGPAPEEIGWRGFALDALQARFTPLVASLILAGVWAAWHAPLLLMQGYYERFGVAPNPIQFVYDIVLTTLIITWIYNHTGRSVLAAVLVHFMVNFSEEIVAGSGAGDLVASALNTLLVLVIIWRGALKAPVREPTSQPGAYQIGEE